MSLAVTIVNSSQARLPSNEIDLMRPRAIELRTVTPCSMPSNFKSSTYKAAPVTFFRPSLRGMGLPTDVICESCVSSVHRFSSQLFGFGAELCIRIQESHYTDRPRLVLHLV